MNKRDKKVFKIAFKEGYVKGTQEVATKSYRQGYAKGLKKSTVIRVKEHTFITVPSKDEKEWENKINWFAWASIIFLILLGITAELYAVHWNRLGDCKDALVDAEDMYNATIQRCTFYYNECVSDYKQCQIESISRPIITQINATVISGIGDGRYCVADRVTTFIDAQGSWYCDMGDIEEIQ